MKRKQKAKAKPRTQQWLADRLDISQGRVSQLMSRPDWRWSRRNWPDVEVAEIKAWHADLRDENNATAGSTPAGQSAPDVDDIGEITDLQALLKLVKKPGERIKLAGVIERAAKVKLDRELLLGGYLKKEDVETGRVARVQAVRQELGNIRLLAIRLEHKPIQEIERELEVWAQGVCVKFERGTG